MGLSASTSDSFHFGLGSSSPSQIGTPRHDQAFSEVLNTVFSAAGNDFVGNRVRRWNPHRTALGNLAAFPGTNAPCLVWTRAARHDMSGPIRDRSLASANSRPLFEETLRTLLRVLPDDWTVATSGLFGFDQLSHPLEPCASFINILFGSPSHPEQAFRVTFTPSMGSIDLHIGDGTYCRGCYAMKSVAQVRTLE